MARDGHSRGVSSDAPRPSDDASDAAQQSADRQSERVQPDDPYTEPDNARTDEWFGQSVDRDAELADQLANQEGGDRKAAEDEFRRRSEGAERQAERHDGA
jgi:hypothetical protein